jgi:hypothetical protein
MTERSPDIRTPLARLAFPFLIKPQERVRDDGQKFTEYSCTLLFPKTVDLGVLKTAAIDVCKKEWGEKAEGLIKSGLIKTPFLDGDGKQGMNSKTGEPKAGFPGHTFIRAASRNKIAVVDKQRLPITDASEIYPGCYVYAILAAYTWENAKQGKGVSFGLGGVQFAKAGERLGGGGGIDPEKAFDVIEDEGDAPASTKSGDGAAGLFG